MQFAVAAYACPDLKLPQANHAMSGDAAAMPDCTKIDPQQANLCQSHCESASQSVSTVPHATIEAPTLPLLAVIVAADTLLPAIKAAEQNELLLRVTAPPPTVRFCVLRI